MPRVLTSGFAAGIAGSRISALAVNDSGVVGAGSELGLVILSKEGSRILALSGEWTALSFAPVSSGLAAVDASTGRLQIFRDLTGDSGPSLTVEDAGRVSAMAYSASGDRIAAADAERQRITIFNLAAGTRDVIDCGCRVTGFEPLAGDLVLLLKGVETLTMLDVDNGVARLASIPPLLLQNAVGRNGQ